MPFSVRRWLVLAYMRSDLIMYPFACFPRRSFDVPTLTWQRCSSSIEVVCLSTGECSSLCIDRTIHYRTVVSEQPYNFGGLVARCDSIEAHGMTYLLFALPRYQTYMQTLIAHIHSHKRFFSSKKESFQETFRISTPPPRNPNLKQPPRKLRAISRPPRLPLLRR